MRARSLKPGICTNEVLGVADLAYTVLYERLWMMADREGRLEDRPLRIKALAFPYRVIEVEPLLAWLAENRFILRYERDGNRYIQILTFLQHQNPHVREPPSKIPPPAEAVPDTGPASDKALPSTVPARLTPDSGLRTADSGLGTGTARAREEHGTSTVLERFEALPLDSRGTQRGVTDCGTALCSSAKELSEAEAALAAVRDEDWIGKAPSVNVAAYKRWIGISESRGKELDLFARIAGAQWLSQQGDHQTQEAVVEQAERRGWKNLRELEKPNGSDSKPKTTWRPKPGDDETSEEFRARR